MSSLLDQAIIDARELREAAIKSAEQTILEKYAPEVKKAVENILDTDVALNEEVGEVSLAAAEGENLCPCPTSGKKEEVEIDFNELSARAGELTADEPEGEEEMAIDLGAEDELEMPLQENLDSDEEKEENDPDLEDLAAQALEAVAALAAEAGAEFENPMNNLGAVALKASSDDDEEDEEYEVDELDEELRVDLGASKLGFFPPSESQREYALELELAREEADEAKKEIEAKSAGLEKLKEKNLKISKTVLGLQERNERYTNVILELEDKINELLLINSRLLFKNRVLESVSLNERQKKNLVEAISKARTPEEAKTIFESLKDVVGSIAQNKREPKSLREATQTPFTGHVSPRRRQPRIDDDTRSRMQRLAGIGDSNFEN